MGSPPLAALQVRAPDQQPGPLDNYGKMLTLQSLLQGQQLQKAQIQGAQQENQIRGQQLTDQQALTKSMQSWDGKSFDDLPGLVLKNGGSAQAVFGLRDQLVTQKTALTKLDTDTLANTATKNDALLGKLQAVTAGPDEGLGQRLMSAAQDAVQSGLIDPQHIQNIQQLAQTPDPQALRRALGIYEKTLQGQKEQFSQAQSAQESAAKTTDANARALTAQTGQQKLQAELPGGPLYAGQVTDKDRYLQTQENMRAALSRQASNANELQRQGITNLQKQSDTYTQFLATANSLKNSLAAAQDGNQLAAAVAPLQGTLFITTSEGVKRINETELSSVAGAGSLVQRIEGGLGKLAGSGPLSPQLKSDMAKLVDLYTTAKYGQYQKQATYTQKLHGLDTEKTPILDINGNITSGGALTSGGAVSAKPGPPAGATMKVPGSDGKLHYSDGKRDLGVAE